MNRVLLLLTSFLRVWPVLAAAFVSATVAYSSNAPLAGKTLPVYYSSVIPVKERQDAVRTELKKVKWGAGPVEILVFGKFQDFMDQVTTEGSPVVIAPSFFGRFHPEYLPTLALTQGESRTFTYQLVALSDRWRPSNLAEGRIGMVEEIGRDQLKRLVPQLLPSQVKLIKTVSKSEDLFPLLAFRTVDFVLISGQERDLLKDKFNMPVRTVLETQPVEMPMIFVRKGTQGAKLAEELRKIPAATWQALGFSGVEVLTRSIK